MKKSILALGFLGGQKLNFNRNILRLFVKIKVKLFESILLLEMRVHHFITTTRESNVEHEMT